MREFVCIRSYVSGALWSFGNIYTLESTDRLTTNRSPIGSGRENAAALVNVGIFMELEV